MMCAMHHAPRTMHLGVTAKLPRRTCCALFVLSITFALIVQTGQTLEVGSTIPMTMYVRTQRQVNLRDLDDTTADKNNDDEHNHVNYAGHVDPQGANTNAAGKMESAIKHVRQGQRSSPVAGVDAIATHLTDSAATARAHSKHRRQFSETLPPIHCARYGVNTVAQLPWDVVMSRPSGHLCEHAKCDEVKEDERAIRFSFGSSILRETTWLPLTQSDGPYDEQRPDADQKGQGAKPNTEEEAHRTAPAAEGETDDEGVPYCLHAVHFHFSYRRGLVNKVTELRVEREYQPHYPRAIQLHYTWRERRPHDPHAALSVCSTCALIAALVVLAFVVWPNGKTSQLFKERLVTVREHAD